MPWFKVDDTLAMHPKVVIAGNAAMGLWVRAGSWSAQQLTDGCIPRAMLVVLGGRPRDARALVDAGLWVETEEGWEFHQWTERQPTRVEVEDERRYNSTRAALHRDPELREAVKARDRGRCRYCGLLVDWKDRRSARGGTYDHVIPRGENTLANLVVACRGCNARKGARTPEEAGMPLLPPGLVGDRSSSDPDSSQKISSPRPDPTRPDPTKYMPPAGPADADASPPTTAQTLIAEWIDHCGARPPSDVVGQVSKRVATMLAEGIPYADVRRGLAAWQAKGLHPSALPSVVHETRTASNRRTSTSTTDQRVADALALRDELRDESAATRRTPAIGA